MEQAQNKYSATEIDSITLEYLNKFVDSINKQIEDKNTPLSFEFIIASLFPNVMKNIQEFAKQKFLEGYNAHE